MKNPKPLIINSVVDIIAPSGKILAPDCLESVKIFLNQKKYQTRFGENIFGHHDFLSNITELRFQDLKKALYAKNSDAVWIYRGGSGASELLPLLAKLKAPKTAKIFLGFSDTTALHLFLNQSWNWVTFHGPGAKQMIGNSIDKSSKTSVLALFKTGIKKNQLIDLKLSPLNTAAKKRTGFSKLSGRITGGNMTVVCHSLGTAFQINSRGKILFLEDVNEPAYKIRRMLTHLTQAGVFKNIKGLIFGEFLLSSKESTMEYRKELLAFAKQQTFPVFKTALIGHGKKNKVIPLNLPVQVV